MIAKNTSIDPDKIVVDAVVDGVDIRDLPMPGQLLRAVITLRPLAAVLEAVPLSFWQRVKAVCEAPLPPRDWATYAARPLSTDRGPGWIRERNAILNRNPLVRIYDE